MDFTEYYKNWLKQREINLNKKNNKKLQTDADYRICEHCGAKNNPANFYCSHCGPHLFCGAFIGDKTKYKQEGL